MLHIQKPVVWPHIIRLIYPFQLCAGEITIVMLKQPESNRICGWPTPRRAKARTYLYNVKCAE